jgi:hypothetical protein
MTNERLINIAQKLIAMATADIDPAATPEQRAATLHEQALAQERADAIMYKLGIDEILENVSKSAAERAKPGVTDIYMVRGALSWHSIRLLDAIAKVTRCKTRHYTRYEGDVSVSKLYGFESDRKYAEMLYTNLSLHMLGVLAPKIDPALSIQLNVYALHNAGYDWREIAEKYGYTLYDAGMPKAFFSKGSPWEGPTEHIPYGRLSGQYRKLYRAECERQGENPTTIKRASTYRSSAAQGYVQRIRDRLYRLENERQAEPGAELAIKVSMQDLMDFYKEDNPDLFTAGPTIKREPCKRCAKAKSGYCREHAPIAYKEPAFSQSAYNAGAAFANRADLGGNRAPASSPRKALT